MAMARKEIVNDYEVGTYHCISRCVRRAFLCGFDKFLNKSFEHRKTWIENRIKHLTKVFDIDIGSYAIMSNHLHIILKNRPDKTKLLSDEDVLNRWNLLYPKYFDQNGKLTKIPEDKLKLLLLNKKRINVLRNRLFSISWFMKSLSEHIARKANFEDKCKGRFWEGRFKCQALLGEAAKLTSMAYVELNTIRAGLNEKLEDSKHTSIARRLKIYKFNMLKKELDEKETKKLNKYKKSLDNFLAPIELGNKESFINMDFKEYVNLVEWTGMAIKKGKKGHIPIELEPVLKRFEIEKKKWINGIKNYDNIFYRVIGKVEDILEYAIKRNKKWFWGFNKLKNELLL